METFQKSGTLPSDEKVAKFLENLAIQSLLALLTPNQRDLLRAATLFNLPVPVPVFQKLTAAATQKDIERLVALGLCEVYEDLYNPEEEALAINNIVRPYAGSLNDDEQKAVSSRVVSSLFDLWGVESGSAHRSYLSYLLDFEMTRLALLASDPQVLACTGANTLRGLEARFGYQTAAVAAKQIMSVLDASGTAAPVRLLRIASERCAQVGEAQEADRFLQRALAEIRRSPQDAAAIADHGATFLTHARALIRQGDLDEAIPVLEQARCLSH
jgi:tetratricopeptide (TPR) repeat protein